MSLSKRLFRCSKPPIIFGILLTLSTLIYTTDYDAKRITEVASEFTTENILNSNIREGEKELKTIVRRKRFYKDIKTTTEDIRTVEYDHEDVKEIPLPSFVEDKVAKEVNNLDDVQNGTDNYDDYNIATTTPKTTTDENTKSPSFYKSNTEKTGNDIDYKDYLESKTTQGKDDIEDDAEKKEDYVIGTTTSDVNHQSIYLSPSFYKNHTDKTDNDTDYTDYLENNTTQINKEDQMLLMIKTSEKPDLYGDYEETSAPTIEKIPITFTTNKATNFKKKSKVKISLKDDSTYDFYDHNYPKKENVKLTTKVQTSAVTKFQTQSPKKINSKKAKDNLVLYFIKNSTSTNKLRKRTTKTVPLPKTVDMEDTEMSTQIPQTSEVFENSKKSDLLKVDKHKKKQKPKEIYRRHSNKKEDEYYDTEEVKTKYQNNLVKNYEKLLQIVESAVPLIGKKSKKFSKLDHNKHNISIITMTTMRTTTPIKVTKKDVPKVQKHKTKQILPVINSTLKKKPSEKNSFIEPDASKKSGSIRQVRNNENNDNYDEETSSSQMDYDEDIETTKTTTTTTTRKMVAKKKNQVTKQKKHKEKLSSETPKSTIKSTTKSTTMKTTTASTSTTTSPKAYEERDVTDVIFPWVAVVFSKNSMNEEFTYACDAALVSTHTVLIAANCLKNKTMTTEKDNILVFLGKRQQNDITIDDAYKVAKVKFHPKFFIMDGREMRNNLALLVLKRKVELVELQTGIAKILDKEREAQQVAADAVVTDAVSTAWVASGDLIPIYFDISKTNKDCLLSSDKKFPFYFCAVHDVDVGTCPSHGGLYITQLSDDNSWYLKGIISEVSNKLSYCGERNIRFTDITKYDKWLKRNIV